MQPDLSNDGVIGEGLVGEGQAAAQIFDVTTMDFEDKVMKASLTQPIVVDFWAPW